MPTSPTSCLNSQDRFGEPTLGSAPGCILWWLGLRAHHREGHGDQQFCKGISDLLRVGGRMVLTPQNLGKLRDHHSERGEEGRGHSSPLLLTYPKEVIRVGMDGELGGSSAVKGTGCSHRGHNTHMDHGHPGLQFQGI